MFRNISAIALKLGNYCNLQCSYCFQRKEIKESTDTFNKYKELLEFLCSPKLTYADQLEIKLTGGEPSLYIKEIRKAYKILKKIERYKDTKVKFTSIFNGANIDGMLELMDEGILDSEGCKLSWDGIKSSDTSRFPKDSKYNSGYYNEVVRKIGENKHGKNILIRIALLEPTVNYILNSFQYAIDCGCRKLEYYYITDNPDYQKNRFVAYFTNMLYGLYDKMNSWEDVRIANVESLVYASLSTDLLRSINCRHLGKMLYIEHNGDIVPCGFFSDDAFDRSCKFTIGNIEKGFYKDKIEEFIEKYKQVPMCYNRNCSNYHCFECPAVNLYRKNCMQDKMMQVCRLRSIEKLVYDYRMNENLMKQYKNIERTFDYTNFYHIEYTVPDLPWSI